MIDLNGPITTFYENCKQQGVAFGIDEAGKLHVTLPDELKANTFFQNEITKRVSWLKELAEMDSLMDRPLGPTDAERLRALAAKYGYELTWQRIPLTIGAAHQGVATDPDWHDPAVQESIDRSYPSWMTA